MFVCYSYLCYEINVHLLTVPPPIRLQTPWEWSLFWTLQHCLPSTQRYAWHLAYSQLIQDGWKCLNSQDDAGLTSSRKTEKRRLTSHEVDRTVLRQESELVLIVLCSDYTISYIGLDRSKFFIHHTLSFLLYKIRTTNLQLGRWISSKAETVSLGEGHGGPNEGQPSAETRWRTKWLLS